jgi:hypothetical protein
MGNLNLNVSAIKDLQVAIDAIDAAITALQAAAFVADEPTDWDGGESPATIQEALDQLAARVKVLEP